MATFIAAARFPKEAYVNDDELTVSAHGLKKHLEDLAQDVGLDPKLNVRLVEIGDEVFIGVSEEFDMFLRESTSGSWIH